MTSLHRGRKRPEQELQIAVAGFLRHALKPPTMWTSIDHGAGKMSRASAGLRKARGVKAGLPDILVLHPEDHYTFVLGIELKADKGSLSPEQRAIWDAFNSAGAAYAVCRSIDAVQSTLRFHGIPLHASVSTTTGREA